MIFFDNFLSLNFSLLNNTEINSVLSEVTFLSIILFLYVLVPNNLIFHALFSGVYYMIFVDDIEV